MRPARTVLILTGLTFGIWEAIDVFWIDVPAVAVLATPVRRWATK